MIYTSASEAYLALCISFICTSTKRYTVRGLNVREFTFPIIFTLQDPMNNVVRIKGRNINYAFMIREFFWYMSGDDQVAPLSRYNPNIKQFSDDGIHLNGAYGKYIVPQLSWLLTKLKEDPSTRQAVIQILPPNPKPSKDIPCTLSLHFQIRHEHLIMTTHMRSGDVYMGLPYDLFSFTSMQQLIASILGLNVGAYHHVVDNLHLYESDLHKVQAMSRVIPTISDGSRRPNFTAKDISLIKDIDVLETLFQLNADKFIDNLINICSKDQVSIHMASMILVLYIKALRLRRLLPEHYVEQLHKFKDWAGFHRIKNSQTPFSFLLTKYLKEA